MKILRKFADKSGPGNSLIVSWDEEERVVVFSLEDRGAFLRMLPETLEAIADAVAAQLPIPPLMPDPLDLSILTRQESAGRNHLTLGEYCAVARSRSGLTLEDVARLLSVSRVTVHAWERRSDDRLVVFWEARGYGFPTEAPVTLVVRVGRERRFDVGLPILDRGVRLEGSDSRLLRSLKRPDELDEHEYSVDERSGAYRFSGRLHGRRSLVVSYEPV